MLSTFVCAVLGLVIGAALTQALLLGYGLLRDFFSREKE